MERLMTGPKVHDVMVVSIRTAEYNVDAQQLRMSGWTNIILSCGCCRFGGWKHSIKIGYGL